MLSIVPVSSPAVSSRDTHNAAGFQLLKRQQVPYVIFSLLRTLCKRLYFQLIVGH